jgi:hypothetical protein
VGERWEIQEECCQCSSSITVWFDPEWPEQPFCDSDCAMEYYSPQNIQIRKSQYRDIKIDNILNDV